MKKKKILVATAIGLSFASAPSWAFFNINWWSFFYKPEPVVYQPVQQPAVYPAVQKPVEYVSPVIPIEPVGNHYDNMSDAELFRQARETFGTLNDKIVPLPNLKGIVKNKKAAIQLGKAFFWDSVAGSDGQACASCHFQAGADPRITNQISPGNNDVRDLDANGVSGDQKFGGTVLATSFGHEYASPQHTAGLTPGGAKAGPNITLSKADFPTHKLKNSADRNSEILYTTNDVVSSMGTTNGPLISVRKKGNTDDKCAEPSGNVFHIQSIPARKVAPRNTPTMINAVFNFRNFWDGRANNIFNGFSVFGERDHANPRAKILQRDNYGNVSAKQIALKDASLASQALGPPLSTAEMSCTGRTFADVGRKLLARKALSTQNVSDNDSVLGQLASADQGLKYTYRKMIRRAFDDKYTLKGTSKAAKKQKYLINDFGNLVASDNGYTMEEINFSLYWGIAVMLYESTLINDDNYSAFGRMMKGDNHALSDKQKEGMRVFLGKGKCANCHRGPVLTSAAFMDRNDLIRNMQLADLDLDIPSFSKKAFYDTGFYNIGVTPSVHDLGLGRRDPYGNPLSFVRQLASNHSLVDPEPLNKSGFIQGQSRVAIDGAFKTPSLMNVALTPPYFHNGGASSLMQVVEFYNRGGNRRDIKDVNGKLIGDTSGTGIDGRQNDNDDPVNTYPPASNLDGAIFSLGLTTQEKRNLVFFMRTLTDSRVRCEQAPFDHPELRVPLRHVAKRENDRAKTIFATVPAVGAEGVPKSECIRGTGELFDVQGRLTEDSSAAY